MPEARRVGPSTYFDMDRVDGLEPATASLVERRRAAMGPAYRLFYEEPLHIVRGSGVHLYDSTGREYLDFYNNVASIGHSHPRVTDAVCTQLGVLNTHTRYLHEGVVRYSEELLATAPDDIDHVMFTCTGSEAGDLALRIAKHRTGRSGVIVTRNAYHGVTTETAAISPSLGGLDSLPRWVRTVAAPDPYRTDTRGHGSLGDWFAAQVRAAIDDLEDSGVGFAALVVDSVFASDGIFTDPVGFLAPARRVVAEAGGVYVADEVQPGFGRTGSHMWGFERHSRAAEPLTPDLVVVGKPMGNGIPIAGVLMRSQLVESFGREQRYFNTFGGNPVSVAAAQAVLDVIREESLMENAQRIGGLLRAGLADLAFRHRSIGDVRGAGLFVGAELVDPEGQPDENLTIRVVNGLRRHGVLVAASGLRNNVLKVRPPLVTQAHDAEHFLEVLDAVLGEERA